MNKVRSAVVAGYFYPKEEKKLREEIKALLLHSMPVRKIENIIGLISPHAGYVYSGRTAAFAFNMIKGKNFGNVIIISPSHREYFPGISIYEGDAFETPLGIVEINNNMVDQLVSESENIFRGIKGHREEHAVEVQIPFLQSVLDEFKIVPIVMGDQGEIFINELAEKICEAADDETLIVASSDLSHYHSKPEAYELDSIVEKRISDFDYDRLRIDLERRNCEACGGGPIIAMMKAASMMNRKKSLVLNRSDSGDASGDYNEVVGYLSAAVFGE